MTDLVSPDYGAAMPAAGDARYVKGTAITTLGGLTMGTRWSVKLAVDAITRPGLQAGIQAVLDRIDAQMSHWRAESALSRFNSAPAGTWHPLPMPFRQVIESALNIARDTDGAFDPNVGELVDLWGFGPRGPSLEARIPSAAAIRQALARSGWSRLSVDAPYNLLRQPGEARLDLSGIAKGFAVDDVCRFLAAQGLPDHLVDIGGELRASGQRAAGQAWRVTVYSPDADSVDQHTSAARANRITRRPVVIALHDRAIATSGDYRHCFELDGRRYSHTIDPRTGQPADGELASVSVVHNDCVRADALATALTVMGPEEGFAYACRHDLAALFLIRDPLIRVPIAPAEKPAAAAPRPSGARVTRQVPTPAFVELTR